MARNPRLKAYYKVDKQGNVVPGMMVLRYKKPEGGRGFYWRELPANVCCTTTTTSSTTTTTTTP